MREATSVEPNDQLSEDAQFEEEVFNKLMKCCLLALCELPKPASRSDDEHESLLIKLTFGLSAILWAWVCQRPKMGITNIEATSQLDRLFAALTELSQALHGLSSKSILVARAAELGALAKDESSLVLLHEFMDTHLQNLEVVLEKALGRLHRQPIESRRSDRGAAFLALVLGDVYFLVTDSLPTVRTDAMREGHKAYGPYLDLVSEIFDLVGCDRSPEYCARRAARHCRREAARERRINLFFDMIQDKEPGGWGLVIKIL